VGEAARLRSSRAERVEIERAALEAAELEFEQLVRDAESLEEAHARVVVRLEEARLRSAAAAARRAESATRLGGLREERQRVADRLAARAFEEGRARARLGEVATSRERARARHDALADTRKNAALALQVREEEARRLAEEHATVREAMVHVRGRLDGLREREEAYDGYAEGNRDGDGLRESRARARFSSTLSRSRPSSSRRSRRCWERSCGAPW
jgi:chromosome segregation ATPase